VLELYTHYKNGHLPFPGGVLDQPLWLMSAFDLIAQESIDEKQ